jgi:rubrerythrin
MDETVSTRRTLLVRASLSGAAVALLAGCETMSAGAVAAPGSDVAILNEALGLEYQAIAAYQLGAESKLLQPAVLSIAVAFQNDHREHGKVLDGVIRKLGGQPVQPKSVAEYGFPIPRLRNQRDVLLFAASLEQSAASAYLQAIPRFADHDLAKAAGSILGVEAMHWATLRQALGEGPVPAPFIA